MFALMTVIDHKTKSNQIHSKIRPVKTGNILEISYFALLLTLGLGIILTNVI